MQIKVAVLLLCLMASPFAFGQATAHEITNSDVISMTKAGIGDQTIILAIQHGPVKFDTSPQALIALKAAGVSDPVLNSILAAADLGSGGPIQPPPTESNAYQNATTLSDPAAKASALESFLSQYPNSVVKKAVLSKLIDTYQQMNDADKALSAASRLLQLEPDNMKAIFFSVYLEKAACQKSLDPATGDSKDPQTCDDAAALAQKGLTVPKPADTSHDDWKKMTTAAYPIFHSAIALDDEFAKKDYTDAIKEYNTELMLYSPQQTTSGQGLVDTLNLAETYSKPGDSRDMVQACWYYARAWNFAPPAYKTQIEPKLEYWYMRYHGGLDGLDAVKTAAQATVSSPASFTITPAPSPPSSEPTSQGLTLKDTMAVKIIQRQYGNTTYNYVVPGFSNSNSNTNANCYAGSTNINCTATTNTTGTNIPARTGSLTVQGATFSLLLPDGRVAVVNCESKFAERMAGRAGNHRSCRMPFVDEIQVEFSRDKAKLEWPVSLDGKKTESETYKIIAVYAKR